MDLSDEKNCEGVTHMCDPAVKFGCRDSGEEKLRSMWRSQSLYKGAICENWPAVGVVLETKYGQHITRLTANCCCSCRQLVSLVSHASSGPDWELGAIEEC